VRPIGADYEVAHPFFAVHIPAAYDPLMTDDDFQLMTSLRGGFLLLKPHSQSATLTINSDCADGSSPYFVHTGVNVQGVANGTGCILFWNNSKTKWDIEKRFSPQWSPLWHRCFIRWHQLDPTSLRREKLVCIFSRPFLEIYTIAPAKRFEIKIWYLRFFMYSLGTFSHKIFALIGWVWKSWFWSTSCVITQVGKFREFSNSSDRREIFVAKST